MQATETKPLRGSRSVNSTLEKGNVTKGEWKKIKIEIRNDKYQVFLGNSKHAALTKPFEWNKLESIDVFVK